MQLGGFWGMTAPMMLMAFDGQWEELYKWLGVLNTANNRRILDDTSLEFYALRLAVSSGVYTVSDVDSVSSELSPFTIVTDGCINGKDDFFNQRLLVEFCNDFLKCVISADSRGRFYSVPEDLPGFVKGVLAGKSIKLNEIPKVLRRALKTLPEAAASTLGKAASKFHLSIKAPDVCCIGKEQFVLSDGAKKIWKWFYDRSDVIDRVIDICASRAVAEEM